MKYLATIAEISANDKEWALIKAARHGQLEVVQYEPSHEIVAAIQSSLTMPLPSAPVYTPLQAVVASANNSHEAAANTANNNNNQENAARGPSYPPSANPSCGLSFVPFSGDFNR